MTVQTEHEVVKSELKWAAVAVATVGVIFAAIIGAALAFQMNPPSNAEMIDPKTLHLSGEFTEGNLGTSIGPEGQVTSRVIATQFAFQPRCIVVPRDAPVTLRFATPDVLHGILVTGTNVNTMIVPGYVSQVHTTFTTTGDLLMPCHEFCGMGHSQMWATVRVVEPNEFRPDAQGRVSCAQS
jgi:cytochrome c oxidase subunit II